MKRRPMNDCLCDSRIRRVLTIDFSSGEFAAPGWIGSPSTSRSVMTTGATAGASTISRSEKRQRPSDVPSIICPSGVRMPELELNIELFRPSVCR